MSGLPTKLYSAEQVRQLDRCAIEEHAIAGYELMKRAGHSVFRAVCDRYAEISSWTVVCGAGNNGGDGYVIARLAAAAGIKVQLLALKPPADLRGDARSAAEDWINMFGDVQQWTGQGTAGEPGLLIDALLGTGIDRPVEGSYREVIEWMDAQACPKIAVDIPSGLNADTGRQMNFALKADLTVSFIGLKRGLLTGDGPDCAGELIFDSLKVPAEVYASVPDSGTIIRETLLKEFLKPRPRNTHKGHFGHVLLAGGYSGMPGAVLLAGEAALRSGSGLVSVATYSDHASTLNLGRPELMVTGISGDDDMANLLERATTVGVGPGLGTGKWSRHLLRICLGSDKPAVIDADGLNLLSENPVQRGNWILTPHPAEAGRLLQEDTDTVQADRVGSTIEIARRYEAVVVLKGCGTVLAGPDGRYAICPLGNPGMATAGSGDVLTGIIASLSGQGLDCWQAAQAGVVIHAAAGDLAAAQYGERSMLASDINDSIARIWR